MNWQQGPLEKSDNSSDADPIVKRSWSVGQVINTTITNLVILKVTMRRVFSWPPVLLWLPPGQTNHENEKFLSTYSQVWSIAALGLGGGFSLLLVTAAVASLLCSRRCFFVTVFIHRQCHCHCHHQCPCHQCHCYRLLSSSLTLVTSAVASLLCSLLSLIICCHHFHIYMWPNHHVHRDQHILNQEEIEEGG